MHTTLYLNCNLQIFNLWKEVLFFLMTIDERICRYFTGTIVTEYKILIVLKWAFIVFFKLI